MLITIIKHLIRSCTSNSTEWCGDKYRPLVYTGAQTEVLVDAMWFYMSKWEDLLSREASGVILFRHLSCYKTRTPTNSFGYKAVKSRRTVRGFGGFLSVVHRETLWIATGFVGFSGEPHLNLNTTSKHTTSHQIGQWFKSREFLKALKFYAKKVW